jgi:NitT/TauT family transport system ATP-binding protein
MLPVDVPNQAPPSVLTAEPIIRAEKIEKFYAQPSQNRIQVISATDLSILPGEIFALLGPSGSGKSTMLRMLSGLSTPTAGQVYWHEKPIAGAEINVSIVFQSFALFPWLTVLENVEAPLQARGVEPEERRARSMKMLDTVGLDGFEAAYPKELSGGMKQRVGFARALVVEPEVLFMDEPFSALDVLTAENLRSELLELWANKTMPTKAVFLVTHNIEEAVLLADRIVVLGRNPGHIRTDFRVQLPQPRDRKSEAFTQLVDYIYKVLTRPDVVPAQAPDQPAVPAVRDQRQMHYQMLPHARPGGVAGLLELLLDRGGRDDIYHLADDLAFEIDDILPIVDAAQLLGFLTVEEGAAAITSTGTEFANSEILRQKELFRTAAVEHVLLLRQIRRALEAKSDHTVPEEFFLDMLDEQFSEDESLRQMETAVTWGRYAELFDFDAGRRRFVLPDTSEEDAAADANKDSAGSEDSNCTFSSRAPVRSLPLGRGHSSLTWAWPPARSPCFLPSSAPGNTGSASPHRSLKFRIPSAHCHSTLSIPSSASALRTCSASSSPSHTDTLRPTIHESNRGW